MKSNLFLWTFFCLLWGTSSGQEITQTLRGTVIDHVTESPIPGARVVIVSSQTPLRAISDPDGNFSILNVPIGRHDILITYLGYLDATIPGVLVDAGKETVLQVRLEEAIVEKEAVEVVGEKSGPANEMSVVSTRTFSVEETQRYAAGLNDPARMATSFAGVVSTQGINNDISIRGNSPRGILWRMEGMDIPNPNHFSGVGTAGGGISIISAQLMGTSDFSTGAFAAEYGNALSGIFDLSLRKGNNEKREFTIQAGVLGLDAAIEGPFKKGYGGSYLVNYRYSTLSLLAKVIQLGDNSTNFQDVSFNVFLPTKNWGNFGVFGFGGLSDDTWKAVEDTAVWANEPWYQFTGSFSSNTGVVGAWHKKRVGNSGLLKTNFSFSGTFNGDYEDSLDVNFNKHRRYAEGFLQKQMIISSNYSHKFSSKTTGKFGIQYNLNGFELKDHYWKNEVRYENLNATGETSLIQAFAQVSHSFSKRLKVNAGVHFIELLLNKSYNVEPRLSASFQITTQQRLSLGYGMHSQVQPIGSYFAEDFNSSGTKFYPNRDLPLNKAQHLVLGYLWQLDALHSLRVETYYQHLYDVPVGAKEDSTFSLINDDYGFETSSLSAKGLGRNYGVEITFDRRLSKGLYYLIAGSLFNSEYRALNGEWYSTQFNTNYTLVVTAGKEWVFAKKEKPRTLGLNLKVTTTDGLRFTPFDLSTVDGVNYPELDYSKSYSKHMPQYFRADVRISWKRNYEHVTSTVSLDLQNALNTKIVAGQAYDLSTNQTVYYHAPGILPFLSYRLTF